jgi:hypothetical protein
MGKLVDDYEVNEASYSITASPVTNAGGFHILGKLSGPHFVPNGTSRNQRYYPKSLWEKVMGDSRTHQKLERKLMFGTIGHADNFDVEKFAREGLLSHITVNMWIDEDTGLGMAEDWILDTPAGRNLYAMCKAGCRFYTSSRASGSFKKENYKGMPVVDESTYDLGGWDMVVDPGFLQADPSLVESMKRNGITTSVQTISEVQQTKSGGKTMSKELIEQLTREKIAVETGLQEALTVLGAYKKIGTPERIREALKQYMALGTPAEIGKAFDIAEKSIKKLQETVKKYEGLGSVPDLEKALKVSENMLNKYKSLGSPEDIEEALDRATAVFEEYKKLGTPKEIDEALDKATLMARSTKKAKDESIAKRLAKAYKAPYKTAYAMVEKLGAKDAEKMLKSLREEDESGYRIGGGPEMGAEIEWPGNEADDVLLKNFDDEEGGTILGDTVGPDGGGGILGEPGVSPEDSGEEGLGGEEGDEATLSGDENAGGAPEGDEDDDDLTDEEKMEVLRKRIRARQIREGKVKGKGKKTAGYKPASIFEQLVNHR